MTDMARSKWALGALLAFSCQEAHHFPDVAAASVTLDLCSASGGCNDAGTDDSGAGLPCLPSLASATRIGDSLLAIVDVASVPESQEAVLRVVADGALRLGTPGEPKTEQTIPISLAVPIQHRFQVHAVSAGVGKVSVLQPLMPQAPVQTLEVQTAQSGFLEPRFLGLRGTQSMYSVVVCTTAAAGSALRMQSFTGAFDAAEATVDDRAMPGCPKEYPRSASLVWVTREPTFVARINTLGSVTGCQRDLNTVLDDVRVTIPSPVAWDDLGNGKAHSVIPISVVATMTADDDVLVPIRAASIAVSGIPEGVAIGDIPSTDIRGQTALSISSPRARKQIQLSLLIDSQFRRSLPVPGPDLPVQLDGGADADP
jgi:hypothetical protein